MPDDLVERVTRALDTWIDPDKVRDAIAVVLEEAATVADAEVADAGTDQDMFDGGRAVAGRGIAAAIRALKETPSADSGS